MARTFQGYNFQEVKYRSSKKNSENFTNYLPHSKNECEHSELFHSGAVQTNMKKKINCNRFLINCNSCFIETQSQKYNCNM